MLKCIKIALLSSSLLLAASEGYTREDEVDYSNTVVIVACRVEDMTGKRPLPDNVRPAPGYKDLDWYEDKWGELQCKRVVYNQTESEVNLANDVRTAMGCARSAMFIISQWNEANEGWGALAVGCPTKIVNDRTGDGPTDDDPIIGWKLPEYPDVINGKAIKCAFNESEV